MQMIRFGAVGAVNTLVDFGVLNILVWVAGPTSGTGLLLCNGVAFLAANLNSYVLNKDWTFEMKSRGSSGQYLLFLAFSFGGLVLNSAVLYLLTVVIPLPDALHPIMRVNGAKAFATAVTMLWNYSTYRHFVFRGEAGAVRQVLP